MAGQSSVKSNGNADAAKMSGAYEAIVPALLQQGILTESELVAVVGESALCKKALTVLKKRKFITDRAGGPDFKYATIWEVQNRDRWAGRDSFTILKEIFDAEQATDDKRRYHTYKVVALQIELITPMLGGTPTDNRNLVDFRRGGDKGDKVWITEGQLRAAMRGGIRLCDKLSQWAESAVRNKYVYLQDVFLDASLIPVERIKCPVEKGGGISLHEAIMPGARIDFEVNYPDNVFTKDNIYEIWARTGRWIGLSPAKHNQGFGKFRLLE